MRTTAPIQPADDPLPWVTAQMRRAGVFDTDADDARRMRAALDVLTSNVAALHDDHPYRVVLSKSMTTAGTAYNERLVLVGSKPLHDDTLTEGQQAAVTMGLVLHEVGHVRWAREYDAALAHAGLGGSKLVGAVSNLAADMHNEAAAMRLFPGLAHAVEVAMWWVEQRQGRQPVDLTTVAGRANAALAACRYPWVLDWSDHPDWLATWQEWGARAEEAGLPGDHVDIVSEALAIIRDLPEPEPEPEPEPGDEQTPTPPTDEPGEPQDGPEGDDEPGEGDDTADDDGEPQDGPEGDDGEDGEGGDDEGTPEGDPTDGADDGTDDGDEPGDEPGGDQPGGSNGDDDDTDDDGEGSGPSAGGDDADDTDEPGDDGTDGDGDGDGEPTDDDTDGQGGKTTNDDGTDGSTGGTDGDEYDPADEDSDDIEDACAAHSAHDDRDEQVQDAIDRILLSERTSGTTYVYRHNTSTFSQRTVVLAKKGPGGFRL